MGTYQYWHMVLEVSKEFKNRISVGNVVAHDKKDGGWVTYINFQSGKQFDAYRVAYLGRLEKSMPNERKVQALRQLAIEKGYGEFVPPKEVDE